MALGAKEWILKGVGDSSDARRDLDQTAAKLDAFDGTTAEAEVQLETRRLKDELAGARAELKSLSTETATPEVDLQTAGLKAHIREIEAQLAILDAKDVNVDVNVDRDGAARGGLMGLVDWARRAWNVLGDGLASGAQDASKSLVGVGGSAGSAGGNVGFLATVTGEAAAAIGVVMVAAIGAGITALAALAASAVFAAGALGALAIAGAALAIPLAGVAVGAIANFKDEADKAGTAANALKTRAQGIASTFKSVLKPAADAVFRGLAGALKGVPDLLRGLKPAFTLLGKAVGDSFKSIGRELTSGPWQAFFKMLTKAAAQAVPLLTSSFISLLRILRNIATAAMPFLIQGLKALNKWLGGLAKGTSNAQQMHKAIGTLVGHLKEWISLGAELIKGFGGFLIQIAPLGLKLVKWLTAGATALSNWVNSAQGQERIKQFFADVLPLAKQLGILFVQVGIALIEAFQAVAPAITTVVQGINLIMKPVIFLLGLFDKIPASVRSWLIPFGAVIATVSAVISVVKSLSGIFTAVRQAVVRFVTTAPSGAWRWITDAARNVAGVVSGIFKSLSGAVSSVLSAGKAAWRWISGAAKDVAGAVRGVISGLAHAVGDIVGRMVGKPWHWLSDAIKAVGGVVRNVVSTLVGWVKSRVNDAIDIIGKIADALRKAKDKAASIAADIAGVIKGAINTVIRGINSIHLHIHIPGFDPPGPGPKFGGIDTDIDPFPNIPQLARGVRNFVGGLAWVGETGPELAAFPPGTDVFTSGQSRSMAAGMGGLTIEQLNITPAEGEWIDEVDAVAQLNHQLRLLGGWG